VKETRTAQASQHWSAALGSHAGQSGLPHAEEDRGLVQEASSVASEGRRTPASPEPWGTDELVIFASSMARQVAQKLSTQDDLVQGVVERFAEDLLWLSRWPAEPSQAALPGEWQQGPEDLLWWPMWWCPFPSQWSDAGADEAPFTAVDELAACSQLVYGLAPNPNRSLPTNCPDFAPQGWRWTNRPGILHPEGWCWTNRPGFCKVGFAPRLVLDKSPRDFAPRRLVLDKTSLNFVRPV
jgi:hypothetical protein